MQTELVAIPTKRRLIKLTLGKGGGGGLPTYVLAHALLLIFAARRFPVLISRWDST